MPLVSSCCSMFSAAFLSASTAEESSVSSFSGTTIALGVALGVAGWETARGGGVLKDGIEVMLVMLASPKPVVLKVRDVSRSWLVSFRTDETTSEDSL